MVAPVDVPVDQREHLPTGALLPPPGVDGLDLHPAEETLRGRVIRRTALRARRSGRPEPLHGFQPSRPPMVTAAVGMRRRTRALGQRGGRLLRHGVGGPRVGAVSGCAGDYLAVVAVDHRRGMRLAVRRLGLGDVRQPPLVGTFGGEVPERSGCRERESSRPVRTAPATSGNMRHEPVPGHDPSDRLLRDAGSGRGLDPAAPVTALGRGERGGHLRSPGPTSPSSPESRYAAASSRPARRSCSWAVPSSRYALTQWATAPTLTPSRRAACFYSMPPDTGSIAFGRADVTGCLCPGDRTIKEFIIPFAASPSRIRTPSTGFMIYRVLNCHGLNITSGV